MTIREEVFGDRAAIRVINERAFGRSSEADLVEALRGEGVVLLSLVAEVDGAIVGHVLFSRMWVEGVDAVALAPMAVLPEFQSRGVGGAMIRGGLETLRAAGEGIVIVLGHADYYPRFGFSREAARELESPFPREAYFALELRAGALEGVRGRVRYPAAFGLAETGNDWA